MKLNNQTNETNEQNKYDTHTKPNNRWWHDRLKVKKFKLTEETKTKKWVQVQVLNHQQKGIGGSSRRLLNLKAPNVKL